MKKLFTLIALLTCFLGAKAIQKIDAEVNFSEMTDISQVQWKSWGGSNRDWFDIQDGCLHYHSDAATANPWDTQVFPIGDVAAEAGVTYTFELKIKGTGYQDNGENEPGSAVHNVNFQVGNANHDKYGAIPVTEDFNVVTVEFECTADGTGHILFQCGSWVGDLWIEYMKIYHEGKEEAPVEWENILENGDASADWAYPDAQSINNAYNSADAMKVSAYGKEYGFNDNNPHAANIEDGVFYIHTNPVDPVLVWDSDGEQWGQAHSAGDPMPDNEWQNQFWINFPRPLKDGEPVKLSFKYKASEEAKAASQDHRAPGDYLGNGSVGTLNFTTEWQEFSKEYNAAAGAQSLAFNLGVSQQYEKDITFYFDDLKLEVQKLEEGFFVAYTDTEDGDPEYDFATATKFEEDGDLLVATVGGESEDTWVNQVMISTRRGSDKGFKAATIKVTGAVVNDAEDWKSYEEGGNAKINLPVRGQWQISIAEDETLINFVKLAGEEDKEKIDIVANPTEYTLHATARESQDWDNQFWIVADRVLEAGEETFIEFEYYIVSDVLEEAKVSTQVHAEPSAYRGGGIGDLTFTTQPQKVSQVFTIPQTNDGGVKSLAFNMACVPEACDYVIKNVIWKLNDDTESLISQTEGTCFYGKIGQGAVVQYPAEPKPAGTAVEGDVNGDNEVGVGDLISVSNYMADGDASGVTKEKADVNKDDEVGVGDLITISNIMAGKEEE